MPWLNFFIETQTTGEEFKQIAAYGGRIDAFVSCPLISCHAPLPHCHIVCPECGCVDAGNPNCAVCAQDRSIKRTWEAIQNMKRKRLKRKGYLNVYDILRVVLVLILFTIAVWRGGVS